MLMMIFELKFVEDEESYSLRISMQLALVLGVNHSQFSIQGLILLHYARTTSKTKRF